MFISHFLFFFFNDPATTEIYTLSLHDALPISGRCAPLANLRRRGMAGMNNAALHLPRRRVAFPPNWPTRIRSEEHTSELQSRLHLVCRLLLEKKKKKQKEKHISTRKSNSYIRR